MLRLIASDIDGTLVPDSAPTINEEYFEVIRALQAKGVRFCPCSGRAFSSMVRMFEPLKDEVYFICENGSVLRTADKILHAWTIPEVVYAPFIEDARKLPGISICVSTPENVYTDAGEDSELFLLLRDSYRYDVENIEDLLTVPEDQVIKISLYHHDSCEEVARPITESHWQEDLQMLCSGKQWVDGLAKNAGKGEAFALLQEYLDIPKEETMYFGDNMNDLTAFKEAGISQTVSSARSEVKESVDYIAHSVKHDGVLQELKKILMIIG